jgi:N-acetylmuramoyl-L-alanine amidase
LLIAIDRGHNCPPDTGATALGHSRPGTTEDMLTWELGEYLSESLISLGHKVINVTPSVATSVSNSLYQRTSVANRSNADIYLSLHFNAYNRKASGIETYYLSNSGRQIAVPIQKALVHHLQLPDRGTKLGESFFVLRKTTMPAILIETCFCDSLSDMSSYEKLGAKKVADIIASNIRK